MTSRDNTDRQFELELVMYRYVFYYKILLIAI